MCLLGTSSFLFRGTARNAGQYHIEDLLDMVSFKVVEFDHLLLMVAVYNPLVAN